MAIEKKFVREQVNRLLIAEFLQKETDRAGFGGIDIQRTPMGTRVSLIAERPGMVIGRRGSNIARLTTDLSNEFKAENPQIEVVEAGRDANLNAKIMARKVAEALERGWHFRRAGHSTVRRIMESGAKGCIVILSGKLTGQRHRTEKFIAGHIKYNGDTALQLMDIGYAQCKKKLGTIGCTVKIMHPDARLPDEVTVYAPGEKEAARQAALRPPPAAYPQKDETPAEERVEGVVPKGSGPVAPTEAPEEERRSRRRVPAPQPTADDIRDAEALAKRMAQQKERRRSARDDSIPATASGPAETEATVPQDAPAREITPAEPKEQVKAETEEASAPGKEAKAPVAKGAEASESAAEEPAAEKKPAPKRAAKKAKEPAAEPEATPEPASAGSKAEEKPAESDEKSAEPASAGSKAEKKPAESDEKPTETESKDPAAKKDGEA